MAGLRSVLLTREGLCAVRAARTELRKGRAAAWSLPRSLARCRIWWAALHWGNGRCSPAPATQTSGAATDVVRTTHAQSGDAAKHVSARKCLPALYREARCAVRGDRVRTVALSSMVLPCTASALAMYLRPTSRRPAYQSAYATRRTIGHVGNLVHARRRPRSRYAGRLRRCRRWA